MQKHLFVSPLLRIILQNTRLAIGILLSSVEFAESLCVNQNIHFILKTKETVIGCSELLRVAGIFNILPSAAFVFCFAQ